MFYVLIFVLFAITFIEVLLYITDYINRDCDMFNDESMDKNVRYSDEK